MGDDGRRATCEARGGKREVGDGRLEEFEAKEGRWDK
jgi:hypothetical protein